MSKSPTDSYHVTELFDEFITASTLKSVTTTFRRICYLLDLKPGPFAQFYPALKKGIPCNKNWKSQSIFSKIEKKAQNKIYHGSNSSSGRSPSGANTNNLLKSHNCLVIGSGPCGLRTAIELQLLGARHVVVVEKRDRFSRNNVLHLWPFVIADLKSLAGKKFYGKFCAGSIDHVSIRQLQLMLLKVAMIIGCEFIENVTFEKVCPLNLVNEVLPTENNECFAGSEEDSYPLSAQKRKLSTTTYGSADGRNEDYNSHRYNQFNDLENAASEETSRSSGKKFASSCDCCCHLHQGKSGRNFWRHISENYIGSYAHFSLTNPTPASSNTNSNNIYNNPEMLLEKLNSFPFDILIGGDGRRNTLNDNFPRKEFRGKLAIAITANFINNHTLAEAQIPEISGISFIYHQEMFKSLYDQTGIDLENICYYKDDTHYFVMTAKKSSLLQRNVLIYDHSDTRALLAPENINRQQLLAYARDAAKWTTGLSTPSFALNHYGEADVAMFDFTSMYAADNACRAMRIVRANHQSEACFKCNCDKELYKNFRSDSESRKLQNNGRYSASRTNHSRNSNDCDSKVNEGLLLISLVGDSLLEPFWPTGSGCGRGFLSSMDAAWLARQWAVKKCHSIKDEDRILQVISERESIYRLLAQTTSENLNQNTAQYTISPVTRYPKLNSSTLLPHQVKHLLYSNLLPPTNDPKTRTLSMAEKRARRATIAITSPFSDEITESQRRVEREFSVINKMKELESKENETNANSLLDYESSLAAFEENYKGLMSSLDEVSEACSVSNLALYSSSVPDYVAQSLYDLSLSPSANNLLTIGKSRARDIESAFRHRRQRQACMKRSEDSADFGGIAYQKAQQHCLQHLRQQLRSKAAWLADKKAELKDEQLNDRPSGTRNGSFTDRIKDLEAKLYAASGLSYLSDESYNTREEPIRLPSTKTGVKVMMTASQLQQLFNPKFQEEKLRQEAKTKANKDIKFVGKLSKQDWNVKCFEKPLPDKDKTKPPPKPPSPPPPQRQELFRDKLNDIQSKLKRIDDHHVPERRTKEAKSNKDFVSLLKTELKERSSGKNYSKEQNKEYKNARDQEKGLLNKNLRKSPGEIAIKREIKSLEPEKIVSSKLCAKCGNIGAPIDRVFLNGILFHQSCLKCNHCGTQLTKHEVLYSGNGNMESILSANNRDTFNYRCTNCMKNMANNAKTAKAVNGDLKSKANFSKFVDYHQEMKKDTVPIITAPRASQVKVPSMYMPQAKPNEICNDSFERITSRIKEQTKSKADFLSASSGIDLREITRGFLPSDKDESKITTKDDLKCPVAERIEYENTNSKDIMLDEDELTKMLNLDPDQWECEGENDSNESDERKDEINKKRDEGIQNSHESCGEDGFNEDSSDTSSSESWVDTDSTDNDFDSDEFDDESSDDKDDEEEDDEEEKEGDGKKNPLNTIKQGSLHRDFHVVGKNDYRRKSNQPPKKGSTNNSNSERIKRRVTTVPQEESKLDIKLSNNGNVSIDSRAQAFDGKPDASEKDGKKETNEDDDDVLTEKSSAFQEYKKDASNSDDSDTLNDKMENIVEPVKPLSTGTFHQPPTTYEEIEFRKLCHEMENQSAIKKGHQLTTSSPSSCQSKAISTRSRLPDKMLACLDSDDDDSKTSLSSLSINVSETYDDIDLSSVWEESNEKSTSRNEPFANREKRNVNRPKHRFDRQVDNNKTLISTNINSKNNYSSNNRVKNFAILKSKTDTSIPDWLPYLYQDRFSENQRGAAYSSKNDIYSAYQKPPLPKSSNSNTTIKSIATDEAKESSPSYRIKPSVVDVKTKQKQIDYSSSQPNNSSPHKSDSKQSPTSNVASTLLVTSPSQSSIDSKENYSKIPVLSARVIAGNSPANKNIDSTVKNSSLNKPSYVSGYSGSFTEKLLSRCRSSPTIPMLGDSLNRWSSSKIQLSSPIKVLSISQAMNAQNNSSSKRSSLSPSNKTTPLKNISSAINPLSLPYADVNEAENE